VRSLKAFSGELLHDFKHRLGRDRASSLPARGDQDRAPGGHLRKPVTQQKRTRRRGGRRGETRRAAHRTAREKAAQARANIKEATDFEEAPPTERAKEPTRTTRTEELSEVAKRSQQHRRQAASARTAIAEDARACTTSRRAKAPTETLHIEVTTSEVTTEAAATGQRPQQQRGSHSSSSRNSEQRAAAAGQPKTCDPFRRSPPSVSTGGAGVEDKEARAGRARHAPPLHGTRGGAKRTASAHADSARTASARARRASQGTECRQQFCLGWGRPANTDLRSNRTINCTSSVEVDTAHKEAHVAAKAAYARSSSQGGVQRRATFLLLDDVSAGLSTRRTDPRRRRARITFAAGLDWEGTKRASARFVLMRNFVRPGYSF